MFNVIFPFFFSSIEIQVTGKENAFKMLLKFEQELVKLLDYEIISIFLKNSVHLNWYKILWNTLYILTYIYLPAQVPGFLTGPSGIRTGWGIKVNDKFEVEWPLPSAGSPSVKQ